MLYLPYIVRAPDAAPRSLLLATPRGVKIVSKVPVSAEEDFLLPGDAGPATAAESGVGTDESHPGMGKRDPPPLVFTKRSSGSP